MKLKTQEADQSLTIRKYKVFISRRLVPILTTLAIVLVWLFPLGIDTVCMPDGCISGHSFMPISTFFSLNIDTKIDLAYMSIVTLTILLLAVFWQLTLDRISNVNKAAIDLFSENQRLKNQLASKNIEQREKS